MHYVTYTKSGKTYHKGAGTLKEMRALAYQILSDIPNLIGGVEICDDKKGAVASAGITWKGDYCYWVNGNCQYLHSDGTVSGEGSKQSMWRINLDKEVIYLDDRFDSKTVLNQAKLYAVLKGATHIRIVNQHTLKVLGKWRLSQNKRWIQDKS